jgi:hypothetical protein
MNDRFSHIIEDVEERRGTVTSGIETMREPQRQAPSTPAAVEEEQQQSVAAPESEPAHRPTCTAIHRTRRSVDEDCVICTMPMVNCSLSELVWCKSSCGRSVHRGCFETMGGYVEVIRCVFWLVFHFFVCLTDLHCCHTIVRSIIADFVLVGQIGPMAASMMNSVHRYLRCGRIGSGDSTGFSMKMSREGKF